MDRGIAPKPSMVNQFGCEFVNLCMQVEAGD